MSDDITREGAADRQPSSRSCHQTDGSYMMSPSPRFVPFEKWFQRPFRDIFSAETFRNLPLHTRKAHIPHIKSGISAERCPFCAVTEVRRDCFGNTRSAPAHSLHSPSPNLILFCLGSFISHYQHGHTSIQCNYLYSGVQVYFSVQISATELQLSLQISWASRHMGLLLKWTRFKQPWIWEQENATSPP